MVRVTSATRAWPFDVPPDEAVVTTSWVTRERHPILVVWHEEDDDGGVVWQFHSGNEDYRPEVLQLIRLDEVLALDGSIAELAALPLGGSATRTAGDAPWTVVSPSGEQA